MIVYFEIEVRGGVKMGQHRGLVMSKKGMVCSAHPLSSWVGADVLARAEMPQMQQ